MNTQKVINFIVIVAIVVVGFVSFHSKSLGDATVSNFPTWYYNGIDIGPNNKLISQEQFGSCTLTGAGSMLQAATATLACSAPGAKIGDTVFVQQDAPTRSMPIVAAKVTTADSLFVTMSNLTGGTTTPSGTDLGVHYSLFR